MISVTYRDVQEHAPRENFKMIDAIWCVFDALF